ncbi:MAG TPA: glycosyltransferase family A protein [Elusimicrobiales bacterium]|nr:glycosyltransferase family A protein [Elusimicrobiales bacterium]
MQQKLTISVVIVTFNRAEMLGEALASLAVQARLPDEVVVVDNDSSDRTRGVAAGFEGRLPLKYVLEKRRSIPAARNAGVQNSSGDIVVFTDDDCVADRQWLYHLERVFLENPAVGLVGGEILPCRHKGTFVEEFAISDALMRVAAPPL